MIFLFFPYCLSLKQKLWNMYRQNKHPQGICLRIIQLFFLSLKHQLHNLARSSTAIKRAHVTTSVIVCRAALYSASSGSPEGKIFTPKKHKINQPTRIRLHIPFMLSPPTCCQRRTAPHRISHIRVKSGEAALIIAQAISCCCYTKQTNNVAQQSNCYVYLYNIVGVFFFYIAHGSVPLHQDC